MLPSLSRRLCDKWDNARLEQSVGQRPGWGETFSPLGEHDLRIDQAHMYLLGVGNARGWFIPRHAGPETATVRVSN